MEPNILLAQLRSLLERTPDFSDYTPTSREHHVWLAQTHALVSRWNRMEAISVRSSSDYLSNTLLRDTNLAQILGSINRAIADLEFALPAEAQTNFAAGDVYNFFNALHKVIGSAEESLFIVDPYLDQGVFDHYLSSRGVAVTVRLLTNKKAEFLIASKDKYNAQYDDVLELRKTTSIHDRVIFVDRHVCWLIGQSVKDAAKAKPTYLVQAPPDIVPDKLVNYEAIWESAQVL